MAAALGFGAAMMRGAGGCALVVVEPAPAAGGHHARVLKAWPNAPGGACSAAVSAVIAPEYSPRKVPAAVAAVTMVGRCRLTL